MQTNWPVPFFTCRDSLLCLEFNEKTHFQSTQQFLTVITVKAAEISNTFSLLLRLSHGESNLRKRVGKTRSAHNK